MRHAAVLLVFAASLAASVQSSAPTALAGTVSSAEAGAMEGVLVRARRAA